MILRFRVFFAPRRKGAKPDLSSVLLVLRLKIDAAIQIVKRRFQIVPGGHIIAPFHVKIGQIISDMGYLGMDTKNTLIKFFIGLPVFVATKCKHRENQNNDHGNVLGNTSAFVQQKSKHHCRRHGRYIEVPFRKKGEADSGEIENRNKCYYENETPHRNAPYSPV